MKTFYHLREFLKENKWKYIWGIFVLIFVDVLQLITPRLLGNITDLLTSKQLTMGDIYRYIAIIMGIALSIAIFRYTWRMLVMGASRDLEYWLRNKFFAQLELLPPSFYNNRKTGDLMAHATNDLNAVRMAFGPGVVMFTDSTFLTITTVTIMLLTTDIRLTLIALLPLPFVAFIMGYFGSLIQKRFKNVQDAFSKLTEKAQETISGIRVVKSFVQEDHEIQNFSEANQSYVTKSLKLIRVWRTMFPLVGFIASLSFLIALCYGGILVINAEITLGQFVSFTSYLGLLTWPMMALGGVIDNLQRGTASMKRINEILDTKPEICDDENTMDIKDYAPHVKFKNLTFTYPGAVTSALSNINLEINEGKTLAIVGRTGSGKTTLVNLILRMYNAEKGQLYVGGHEISKIPVKTLRNNIGYVPQDNFLFSTPIRDNIAFSNVEMPMEKVEEAAKIAQVYDNIIEFPEKFDTVLGERGVTLSGGQKQRVSIARAIAKNPKILILDDSLSAVDTKTEESILQGLKTIMKNRTSIIIAHRISTIKDADEIIVLDEGRIVERGTHDQLVQKGGLYNSIYEKQLLEEKIENEA